MIVSVIHCSPRQNSHQFELFLSNLENLLSDINKCKPSLSVVTGDFNMRSSSWWCNKINTIEGSHLYSLTSSNGLSQLINEPTHIQTNSSSCIDLIFTNQPNLSLNSLKWDYKKAVSTNIRKVLDSINWDRLFDKKHCNSQLVTLNETILNVFRNYILNKYITINNKDPVCINKIIKSKM